MNNSTRKAKSPAKVLEVKINGKIVKEKNSTETFLSVLRILGPQRIAEMKDVKVEGLPLVVSSKDYRMQLSVLDKYWYACTNMPTHSKKRMLELLAHKLNVNIIVTIHNGKEKTPKK